MVTPDRAMFCASILENCDGIRHGFFTRQGGVSRGIYSSLNCGLGSGDDAENVRQNRALVAETLGVLPDRLLTLYQIHSAMALIVDKPWSGDAAEADALVTRTPGLAIGALTADCAPILLCDHDARVIAAAHAGWRGALAGIAEATVATMEERLTRAGVGSVSDLGLCTYCDETRLFSYRRSQHHGEGDYGRQISAIVLT